MEQVLYELPEGWGWKNLTDVTRIGAERGFVPEVDNGKTPFIGMSNIDQDTGLDSVYELRDFESVRKGYTKFQKNAVLLAKITPCTENNKTALIQDINGGYATTEVYPIHSLPETYPYYLLQFLRSPSIRELLVSKMEGATGRQRVPTDAVSSLKIPLPPFNEQKRIVTKLNALFTRIDTAIAHLQQTLELSKALFASALSAEFQSRDKNWQSVQLSDVCSITSKLSDPREPEYIDMIHVGGANIESLTGSLRELKTAREEKLISGKFPFDDRMVLYSKIRPYLMKVARPNINGLCSADIYPLTPSSEVLDRDFLFYLLLSEDFSAYAIQGSSRAGMPKVNRKHLFSYEFSIPSIEEQKQITTHLDALSERTRTLEAATQEKLNDLTTLKASLLDAAFKGQL